MRETEDKRDKFQPRIYIDREGNWYQDGIPILHRWTYLYNNKLLKRDEDGRYYIDEGRGRVYAQVEDTPFVVKMVDRHHDGLYLILNDETEEKLDFDALWMNEDNTPYTKIKNGKFEARFSRAAYYEFTKYLKEEGDKFYIVIDGTKHLLKVNL